MDVYKCPECKNPFSTKYTMYRHLKNIHETYPDQEEEEDDNSIDQDDVSSGQGEDSDNIIIELLRELMDTMPDVASVDDMLDKDTYDTILDKFKEMVSGRSLHSYHVCFSQSQLNYFFRSPV
jgi:hypothetical protein